MTDDHRILRDEFHAFWNAGLSQRDYLDQSAIVCYLDLDQEQVTLTRVFFCTSGGDDERAEDHMIDWFHEEMLIQKADNIDISIYMNYSPLKLTVDGLITVFNNLKEMGKEVKATLKFVELYKTDPDEENAEENREGLRQLHKYGVEVHAVKERDWVVLMQTLTKKSTKKRQEDMNTAARKRLLQVLKDPRDVETSTDVTDTADAEVMTDPQRVEVVHSSSSSDESDEEDADDHKDKEDDNHDDENKEEEEKEEEEKEEEEKEEEDEENDNED